MLKGLLNGILPGIGAAVPFGPINLLILSYVLSSFKKALFPGFGTSVADAFYLLLPNLGTSHLLNRTSSLEVLAISGFCLFNHIAFLTTRKRSEDLGTQKSRIDKSYTKNFLKGLSLNLLDPYIIGFWLSFASLSIDYAYPLILALGLVYFIFIWILVLSLFVGKFSHPFGAKVIHHINIFLALIIEYFALNLLYKTFWG